MKKILAPALIATAALVLTGCSDDAQVADRNLTRAADNFEVYRQISFINGITDEYLLTIEGRCSINDDGNQLEVICKTGPDEIKKHFLGLSDNVTYVAEQLEPVDADEYRHRVTFKPEQIIPSIDLRTSNEEG